MQVTIEQFMWLSLAFVFYQMLICILLWKILEELRRKK